MKKKKIKINYVQIQILKKQSGLSVQLEIDELKSIKIEENKQENGQKDNNKVLYNMSCILINLVYENIEKYIKIKEIQAEEKKKKEEEEKKSKKEEEKRKKEEEKKRKEEEKKKQ